MIKGSVRHANTGAHPGSNEVDPGSAGRPEATSIRGRQALEEFYGKDSGAGGRGYSASSGKSGKLGGKFSRENPPWTQEPPSVFNGVLSRFKDRNPEFVDVGDAGDWTANKWTRDV